MFIGKRHSEALVQKKKKKTQRSQKQSNQNIIEILGVETFDLSKE